jgi:hypothetical protein
MLEYVFKSLTAWPGKETPAHERQESNFYSKWTDTLNLLERETRMLGALRDSVTVATYHPAEAITRSGAIRVGSKLPPKPGVIVSFEVNNKGQRRKMQYECDRFRHWEDNVRAIALALEALRKVDRYGVGRAGAQYQGYLALPPAFVGSGMTLDDAWATLARFSEFSVEELQGVGTRIRDAYRQASMRTHPDRGGNQEDSAKVNVAYEVLQAHLGMNGSAATS